MGSFIAVQQVTSNSLATRFILTWFLPEECSPSCANKKLRIISILFPFNIRV